MSMSMVTTTSSMSSSRVARRVRVARDDDEDGARADGQTRAPRARAVVAAMDGACGAGSRANEVRARACIFGWSIARVRGGDRVAGALARGVRARMALARARARDGAGGT